MVDVRISIDAQGADLALEGGDLERDDGLRPAALVSLFTDGRLEPPERVPDEGEDRRGWWPDTAGDRHGSLLWTLERTKTTTATARRVEEAARLALQWLIDDGIVEEVETRATIVTGERIDLEVRLLRGQARRWQAAWTATEAYDFAAEGLRVRILPL